MCIVSAAQRLPDLIVARVAELLCCRLPPLLLRAYPDSEGLNVLVPLMGVCSAWRRASLPLYYRHASATDAVSWDATRCDAESTVYAAGQPRLDTYDFPHLAHFVSVDVDAWIGRLKGRFGRVDDATVANAVFAALSTLLKAIPLTMPNVNHVVLNYSLDRRISGIDRESLAKSVNLYCTPGLTQIRYLTVEEDQYIAFYPLDSATPVLTRLWISNSMPWRPLVELVRTNAESLECLCIDNDEDDDFGQIVDGLIYPRLTTLIIEQCWWLDNDPSRQQQINHFPCLAVLNFEGYLPHCLYRAICSNRLQTIESWIWPSADSAESLKAALAAAKKKPRMSLVDVIDMCRDSIQVFIRARGCEAINSPSAPLAPRPVIADVKITCAKFTIEEVVSIVRLCPELLSAVLSLCISPSYCRSRMLIETAIRSYRSTCSVRGASIRWMGLDDITFVSTTLACTHIVLLADLLPTLTNVMVGKDAIHSPQLFDQKIHAATRRPVFQSSPHLKRVRFELDSFDS